MSNFSPKLENATDEELMNMINELDLRVVPLASDELTRRTIRRLREIIETFNKQSSKQTQKMIQLTRYIVGLTIVMIFGLVVQVILSLLD